MFGGFQGICRSYDRSQGPSFVSGITFDHHVSSLLHLSSTKSLKMLCTFSILSASRAIEGPGKPDPQQSRTMYFKQFQKRREVADRMLKSLCQCVLRSSCPLRQHRQEVLAFHSCTSSASERPSLRKKKSSNSKAQSSCHRTSPTTDSSHHQ